MPFARHNIRHVKNYVLCMPECYGNYSIPIANDNVEVVDMLAAAGILNLLHIYVHHAPHYSVDKSRFWSRVTSVVHKRFLSKLSICRLNLYWPMFLVSCTIVS